MPKLIKRSIVLAAVESAYNVDANPTASANALLVENFAASFTGQRMTEDPAVKPTLGARRHIFGGTLMQATFDVAIKGSGSVDVPPEFGPALRACALSETITALTSVAYAPISTGFESCTLVFNMDGMEYRLTGCRGTPSFNLAAGSYGKISFTLTGHLAGMGDVALPTPVYDATVQPAVISAGFSVNAYSAVIASLAFDMNNTIATPDDINSADSYGEITITGRDVSGSFDPEAVAFATHDFIAEWRGGDVMALGTGVIGSAAGNRYSVSQPAISYRELGLADRDGIAIYEIGYGAAESIGDDEFTLTFT